MAQKPPGILGDLTTISCGGDDNWRELAPFKHYTNAFIWNKDTGKMLLGLKKRGFGKDMYNGFGGKVEAGESPKEAALRELLEEAGVTAPLEPFGVLVFVNAGQSFTHYIHLFKAHTIEGEPKESDEMRPKWFAVPKEYTASDIFGDDIEKLPQVPFERMWPDDRLWFPIMFSGDTFQGRVDFREVDRDDTLGSKWIMERWWFGSSTE